MESSECPDVVGQRREQGPGARADHEVHERSMARLAALDRSQAVIEFDLDGFVVDANQNYLDLLGYDLHEIVGQHHRMFCTTAYGASESYEEFWAGLRSGEFASGEFERVSRDGTSIWIRATYNPILDSTGRAVQIVKFALDVTAEKQRAAADESRIAAINRSHGVVEFDLDGRILSANDEFLEIVGFDREGLVGRHHRVLCDPQLSGSRQYSAFWEKLRRGEFESGEFRRRHRTGRDIWIQATYHPILDAHGNPHRIVKFALDITEPTLRAIDASNRIAAIERADCVIEMTPDGTITRINDNYASLLGVDPSELTGQPHAVIVAADDDMEHELWDQLDNGYSVSGRFARCAGIGATRWLESTYHPVADADGRILSIVSVGHDATTAVEYEDEMRRRAELDWLTGVANRETGFKLVAAAVDDAIQTGSTSLLAFIDLDGFKQINDTYGHRVGDVALCAAADRLAAAAGPGTTVARLGGDEFIVIAPRSALVAVEFGELLRLSLAGAIRGHDHPEVHVAGSVGVLVVDASVTDAATAIRRADLAAYDAKGAGRGCSRVYSDAIDALSRERHLLEDDLRSAVRHGRLGVAFQPMIDMVTGEVFCVEALLRFDRPGIGPVDTREVIAIAETSELIVDLDRFVMERALEQLAYWGSEHLFDCDISINVSAQSAVSEDFVGGILAAIDRHGVDPTQVVVEVTEDAILGDLERTSANMGLLRDAGIRVALDDFGARHASLGRLWDFPVDIVKIDENFALTRDERAEAMLELIVRTVQKLGYPVIAEGVESADEQARLLELGITIGQGSHLTAPDSSLALLSQWTPMEESHTTAF